MKRIFGMICLLLLAGGPAAAQDLSSPERTIRSFLATLSRGDMAAATRCVSGAKRSPTFEAALARQHKRVPTTHAVEGLRVQTRGNTATAAMTVTSRQAGRTRSRPERASLRREGAAWKIVPVDPRTFRSTEPGVVTGVATLLADPPAYISSQSSQRPPAQASGAATRCLSNVKQLNIGAVTFVRDHDRKFALQPSAYRKSLVPYVRNERLFHCPADRSGAAGYAFNRNLAGVSLGKVRQPHLTVMIYEGAGERLLFRHDGTATVGFVDGSARSITREQAKTLRWKP